MFHSDSLEFTRNNIREVTHERELNFRCNLGKVAANAMMTARHKIQQEVDAYVALFVYAQQFYGSKYSEEFTFKMFVSTFEHRDLIFQVRYATPEFPSRYAPSRLLRGGRILSFQRRLEQP